MSIDPIEVASEPGPIAPSPKVDPAYFGIGKLFDVIREGVIVANAETERIVLWNPAATAVFGYSEEEAVGMPLHRLVPESLRDRHRAGIRRYAETGRGDLIGQRQVLELPALRKDGTEITIEFSLTPLESVKHESRFALAIIRDVTERIELEQLKNDFVAMVAHDLRSPMSVIAGFAETLNKRWDDLETAQRNMLLEGIARNVYSLDHLVEDVLHVARLESGHFSYDSEPFDLKALVQRTVAETPRSEGEPEIELQLEEGLPPAVGDELRNWQILNNLISNAFKFSSPGSPVLVTLSRSEDGLRVEIVDQGVGITEQDVKRLFNKFFRVSQGGGKAAGTGLGLYICRLMVEAQGGTIGVSSQPGKGSTFYYTIPAGEPES